MGKLKRQLVATVSLDTRSLSLFRIGLGGFVIGDLIFRMRDFTAFHTNLGIVRADPGLTLNAIDGSPEFQAFLFGLLFVFALMVLSGIKARLGVIGCLVLLLSMSNNQPGIETGGDSMIRMWLMIGALLPLDTHFCVGKTANDPPTSVPKLVYGFGSVWLTLEVAYLYTATAYFKLLSPSWTHGSILIEAMHIDPVVTDFGRWLLNFPDLLWISGLGALWFEVFGFWLFFFSYKFGAVRLLCIAGFFALHLGIAGTLRVGTIPFAPIVVWLAFIPPFFWDNVLSSFSVGSFGRSSDGSSYYDVFSGGSKAVRSAKKIAFAALLMLLIVGFPAGFSKAQNIRIFPDALHDLVDHLGLNHYAWSLWTNPAGSRRYVVAAKLNDSSTYDLYKNGPLDWDNPRTRPANNHWYKLIMKANRQDGVRDSLVSYFVREWNRDKPDDQRVQTVQFGIMQEPKMTPQWWLSQTDVKPHLPRKLTYIQTYRVRYRDGEFTLVPNREKAPIQPRR